MASVIGDNEILLNSKRYKIAGPVRKTLVSIAAPRFTIVTHSVVLTQGLLSLRRMTFVAVLVGTVG